MTPHSTMTPPIPMHLRNNNFRTNSNPNIAADRNGDLSIVWADNRYASAPEGAFGTDILIATSTDGGLTWITNIVNYLDASDTDQFFPTVNALLDPTTNLEMIHVSF